MYVHRGLLLAMTIPTEELPTGIGFGFALRWVFFDTDGSHGRM